MDQEYSEETKVQAHTRGVVHGRFGEPRATASMVLPGSILPFAPKVFIHCSQCPARIGAEREGVAVRSLARHIFAEHRSGSAS